MFKSVREIVERIPESAWTAVADYPGTGEAQIAETTLGGRLAAVWTVLRAAYRMPITQR